MSGKFIVIEGADACGKETQSKRLVADLIDAGYNARRFAFHRYETELGTAIRAHLKRDLVFRDRDAPERVSRWSDLIFQSMAVADKYEGAGEIADYVADGGIAVCDRWWQSAYAYGASDGLPEVWLTRVHRFLPRADLNLLVNVPLEEARRRRPIPEDRYEEADVTQRQVRENYLRLWDTQAALHAGTWLTIDGVGTIDEVADRIWSRFLALEV